MHGKSEVLILCERSVVNYLGKGPLEVRFFPFCPMLPVWSQIHTPLNMGKKKQLREFYEKSCWSKRTFHIFQNVSWERSPLSPHSGNTLLPASFQEYHYSESLIIKAYR